MFRTVALTSLAALVIALGGCDITSLNDNPNQPTSADPPKLLSDAQANIADQYWQDYAGGFWVRYAQYWTTNQYTDADRYSYASSRPGGLNALFENYYLSLNNLQQIIRINQESPEGAQAFGPNDNQVAIAKIMQAWTLKTMTDMFGPIPLSEALEGRTVTEGNEDAFSPPYDGQEAVYDTLLTMLTQASQQIDTGAPTLASGDKIYGGDMSKWKKFANSLKMRVAITLADRKPGVAETAIEEALSAGVFESNDDSALLPFDSSPPFQNPFYENNVVSGRDDWAAPESILGPMNETNDPRRPAYFSDAKPETEGNQFIGFPYGLSEGAAQSLFVTGSFSRPSDRVAATADAPCIFMLHDEVLFIKAEAKLRGLDVPSIDKSGQALYEDAIRASMRYWGAGESAIDDYFAQSGVPTPVTSGNFRQVLGTQKWIAQYLQGVPGWTTFRRMDFEGVLSPPAGDPGEEKFGRSFAVRMKYPNQEFSLNAENVNTAVSDLLGGDGASADNQGVLLYWDTSPPPNP
jgi:hypothetical protein